jgi:hypothetical protein
VEVPIEERFCVALTQYIAARRHYNDPMLLALSRMLLVSLAACALSPAAVTKIYLVERHDIPGYPYERVVAKAHFAIDPNAPANRLIRDIQFAPRNDEGLVEFSADLYVIKPRNSAEGNGTALFEVSNRGNKGMLGMFNHAPSSLTPKTEADMGDGYLLKQGYTLVWLGWQADVPMRDELLRLHAPIARRPDGPITGVVRSQWIVNEPTKSYGLGDRDTHIPYPVREGADANLKLTIQDTPTAPRREIPRSQWQLGREEFGRIVPDRGRVYMAAGFQPGKIYELIYETQDPLVIGLGPAGIRDLISFLKYENAGTTLLGEQSRHIKRAIGFGTSQSGRFLRTFLYTGFNADEKGRKVFDGVWPHVAGGGLGSFNHRFAQPSRDGHPFLNLLYPTDIFPFTDEPQKDPETGLADGILAKATEQKVVPKIFYTNGSYEYWGRAASLIHTSVDGKSDLGLGPDSRAYLLSGTQHGPGTFPPRRNGTQNLANPNNYRYILRALLARMNDWIKTGAEPPPSQIPLLSKNQLVPYRSVQFPKLAGVRTPPGVQMAWRSDYGPEFRSHGIVTHEPPKLGSAFPVLVPQVDADGNETSGIRLPELQVPLATYTGWNLRDASVGAPGQYFNMVGSFFPFAPGKAARQKLKDPRPSIEERYPSRDAYLAKVRAAAQSLAAAGFLLTEDIPALEQRAVTQWDTLHR